MNVYWEHNLRFFTGKFHLYLFKLQGTSYGTGSDFIKDKHVGKVGFRTTAGMVHTFNRRLDVVTGLSYEIKGLKFKAYSENPDYNPPAMTKVVQDPYASPRSTCPRPCSAEAATRRRCRQALEPGARRRLALENKTSQ